MVVNKVINGLVLIILSVGRDVYIYAYVYIGGIFVSSQIRITFNNLEGSNL